MTELQLQAIVNQQGIEGTGESNLDMTVIDGVSVSKWRLDSVTYGWQRSLEHSQRIVEEVSSAIRWK
jgi:hypothetical protein